MILLNLLNSSNKCNSKELTRDVSCVKWQPQKLVKRKKRKRGILYKHLRRSHRKRKKRYVSPERRGQIPDRVSIDDRPRIVETKERIGDWEADTVIGRNHKGAIITLVERKSK